MLKIDNIVGSLLRVFLKRPVHVLETQKPFLISSRGGGGSHVLDIIVVTPLSTPRQEDGGVVG